MLGITLCMVAPIVRMPGTMPPASICFKSPYVLPHSLCAPFLVTQRPQRRGTEDSEESIFYSSITIFFVAV